ncbi:stringent starvation protein B [Planctobacterium marinum]|uniref:Stringent starvation protein B n=2 Tax=Planctobacterium marinum TaxID=1631968 RepID=A0AA48I3G5_9ALTE|nr:stringent starvation protein B [Planctobacterium marinum]
MNMTSNRPYLIRAYYDWIVDNNLTPHLVVDANFSGVVVPNEYVKDGQIVLNVSPSACGNLQIGDVDIEFDARFSGVPRHLIVPAGAVLAIYARENGAGTMFPREEKHSQGPKVEDDLDTLKAEIREISDDDHDGDDEPPKPPRGRPTLKVVK